MKAIIQCIGIIPVLKCIDSDGQIVDINTSKRVFLKKKRKRKRRDNDNRLEL